MNRFKFIILTVFYIFGFVSLQNYANARNVRISSPGLKEIQWVSVTDKSSEYGIKPDEELYAILFSDSEKLSIPMQNPARLPEIPDMHNRVYKIYSSGLGGVLHLKGIGMRRFPVQHLYDLELVRRLIKNERVPAEALDQALIYGALLRENGEIVSLEDLEKSIITCFTYYPNQELAQQFWGGARESVIRGTISAISEIKNAYQEAKRQNDSFLKYLSQNYGLHTLPIMEPAGIFQPDGIPVYVKNPEDILGKYSDKLTESKKLDIANNREGVYVLENGLDIAGIPQEIQKDYIIFAYLLPTGERINELRSNPLDKVSFQNVAKRESHIARWKNVFRHFGYEINFHFSLAPSKEVDITVKKEGKIIPIDEVKHQIITESVIRLSSMIHIVHNVMNKSLGRLHESGQYFGPFEPGNVDASGWISDIIALRGEENQHLDIEATKNTIKQYCEALGITNNRKYLQFFENLLNISRN